MTCIRPLASANRQLCCYDYNSALPTIVSHFAFYEDFQIFLKPFSRVGNHVSLQKTSKLLRTSTQKKKSAHTYIHTFWGAHDSFRPTREPRLRTPR